MEKALHGCSEAMNQWPPSLTALVSISFTLPEGGLRWQLEQDTLVPVPVNVCRACLIDPHSGLWPLPVCGHTERVDLILALLSYSSLGHPPTQLLMVPCPGTASVGSPHSCFSPSLERFSSLTVPFCEASSLQSC